MTTPPPPPPSYDAVLHRYLAANDAPCPACGYNLRGLTGDACPECHTPVALATILPGGAPDAPARIYADWYRTTRAWLMLLLAAGVTLAAVHILAGLIAGAGTGFTRRRLIRMGAMTLLSLSPVIVLMLWERYGRIQRFIDPGTGQARGWGAIAAAAAIIAASTILLFR